MITVEFTIGRRFGVGLLTEPVREIYSDRTGTRLSLVVLLFEFSLIWADS